MRVLRAFGALRRCSDVRSAAAGFFAMLGGLASAAIVRCKPTTVAVGAGAGTATIMAAVGVNAGAGAVVAAAEGKAAAIADRGAVNAPVQNCMACLLSWFSIAAC